MIRTVLYFYIILLVVSSGLLLTGNLKGENSTRVFSMLDSTVNSFVAGGVGATGDINGLSSSAGLVKSTDVPEAGQGFFDLLKNAVAGISSTATGIANVAGGIVSIVVFLAVGSADIINVIDPGHTWGLLIIAPIAMIQLTGFVFLLVEIISALRGGG